MVDGLHHHHQIKYLTRLLEKYPYITPVSLLGIYFCYMQNMRSVSKAASCVKSVISWEIDWVREETFVFSHPLIYLNGAICFSDHCSISGNSSILATNFTLGLPSGFPCRFKNTMEWTEADALPFHYEIRNPNATWESYLLASLNHLSYPGMHDSRLKFDFCFVDWLSWVIIDIIDWIEGNYSPSYHPINYLKTSEEPIF